MTARQVFQRRLDGRRVRGSVIAHHGLTGLFDATDDEVVAALRSVTQDGHGGGDTPASWADWCAGVGEPHARALVDLWR